MQHGRIDHTLEVTIGKHKAVVKMKGKDLELKPNKEIKINSQTKIETLMKDLQEASKEDIKGKKIIVNGIETTIADLKNKKIADIAYKGREGDIIVSDNYKKEDYKINNITINIDRKKLENFDNTKIYRDIQEILLVSIAFQKTKVALTSKKITPHG